MASNGTKSAPSILLILNLVLYFVITVIAAWAVNHGIEKSHESASVLQLPARIFPIYFPFGNMATGFFIIFSLIAGVVGMTTSITCCSNLAQWDVPNVNAAYFSCLLSLCLTILAMGLACKEIALGFTDTNLRTLEIMTIITSATQLLCAGIIRSSAVKVAKESSSGGRV